MLKKAGQVLLAWIIIFVGKPIYAKAYGEVSQMRIFFELIIYLVIFAIVIFVSLYGTRLVAKNFKGITGSKYMNILDAINIPGGSKIVITKINAKIYILAINNNTTNILDIIDEVDFPIIDEEEQSDYLSRYFDKDRLYYDKIGKSIKSKFDRFNRKKR